MDQETEIRRTINYVADLIQKSDAVMKGETKDDYREYYRNYQEAVTYLKQIREINTQLPELVKPTIFNKRLGGLWAISVLGLFNPFLTILIFTLTLPVSLPYLVVRGVILNQTKNKIEEAKKQLTEVLNKLKEQRIEKSHHS